MKSALKLVLVITFCLLSQIARSAQTLSGEDLLNKFKWAFTELLEKQQGHTFGYGYTSKNFVDNQRFINEVLIPLANNPQTAEMMEGLAKKKNLTSQDLLKAMSKLEGTTNLPPNFQGLANDLYNNPNISIKQTEIESLFQRAWASKIKIDNFLKNSPKYGPLVPSHEVVDVLLSKDGKQFVSYTPEGRRQILNFSKEAAKKIRSMIAASRNGKYRMRIWFEDLGIKGQKVLRYKPEVQPSGSIYPLFGLAAAAALATSKGLGVEIQDQTGTSQAATIDGAETAGKEDFPSAK